MGRKLWRFAHSTNPRLEGQLDGFARLVAPSHGLSEELGGLVALGLVRYTGAVRSQGPPLL